MKQNNTFLAVVWEKARPFEAEVREKLSKDFTILAETEMFWPKHLFTKKLRAFYGFGSRFTWWNKARKCGRGAFKVIVFKDESPTWKRAATAYGNFVDMDVRVNDDKRVCRLMTGHRNVFHASLNAEETERESHVLFGCSIEDWLAARARWRIPESGELEAFFAKGDFQRIGDGSRRVCYRIPDSSLCVKSYRSEDELETRLRSDGTVERHLLASSVVREIRNCRFSDASNTSCQEWRYYATLKECLPLDVMGCFPDVLERVMVPSRGWCLVENVVSNFDGTAVRKFSREWRNADSGMRQNLLSALTRLEDVLSRQSVRFYDPPNVMVQWLSDGSFRLRILDFEPASRTLVPLDFLGGVFVEWKTRRRFARFRHDHLGVA